MVLMVLRRARSLRSERSGKNRIIFVILFLHLQCILLCRVFMGVQECPFWVEIGGMGLVYVYLFRFFVRLGVKVNMAGRRLYYFIDFYKVILRGM